MGLYVKHTLTVNVQHTFNRHRFTYLFIRLEIKTKVSRTPSLRSAKNKKLSYRWQTCATRL